MADNSIYDLLDEVNCADSCESVIIMAWQSHLSDKVRAIVPMVQSHFDFA